MQRGQEANKRWASAPRTPFTAGSQLPGVSSLEKWRNKSVRDEARVDLVSSLS